jgi:sterol-4alpha-carboxylate 3-dehydrogenase (decarboxylating)
MLGTAHMHCVNEGPKHACIGDYSVDPCGDVIDSENMTGYTIKQRTQSTYFTTEAPVLCNACNHAVTRVTPEMEQGLLLSLFRDASVRIIRAPQLQSSQRVSRISLANRDSLITTYTYTMSSTLGVVLVVGGCGYLGSDLVKALRAESLCSEIHVVSRKPEQNIFPGVTYHAGDIANSRQVTDLFAKINPRVVFHTASPKDISPAEVLWRTNVEGTRNLLKAAADTPSTQAFIYTSSDSALQQMPGVKQTEEIAKLHTEHSKDANPYAKTKALADANVQAANSPALATVVLRIPGMYGENDDNSAGRALSTIKKDEHKVQLGDNKPVFEFVFVEKASEAHILAAKRILEGQDVGGQAFFISDGVTLPYFDYLRKLYAGAGYPVLQDQIKVVPLWFVIGIAYVGEWLYYVFTFNTKVPEMRSQQLKYLAGGCSWDITKAKEKLGYQPVVDQDATITKVAQSEIKRLGIEKKQS